jgi:hypothetical protein
MCGTFGGYNQEQIYPAFLWGLGLEAVSALDFVFSSRRDL